MTTSPVSEQRPARAAAVKEPGEVTIVAHDVGSVGGMERVLGELIEGLVARGHRLTVIARKCVLNDARGVNFCRVRGPARPFVIAYPWFMVAGALALRRHGRGVVHATGAIVPKRVDVVAIHYCHRVGPSNPSRSNLLFAAHTAIVRLLARIGERVCYRPGRAAAFVCVSEGVAEEVRRSYPRISERVVTIHNGVDVETFAPDVRGEEARARRARLGLAPGTLLAAFVGSEWERKGLRPAIEALAGAPEWSLAVAGDGEEGRYRELAREAGVAERVVWLGRTADVQLVYALADAFVLPTSYETFSLVTFEAAASGLPILATPVSGVEELIEDGYNGFLIERDAGVIAARLRELAADAELRRRMGDAARQSARRFSWDEMVARHEELYQRLSLDTA
jgi:UDP-glucose:(heptosyl)LPS alpha-1,3-glucosyltransferase